MSLLVPNKSGKTILQMDTQALRQMCIARDAIPHVFFVDMMKGECKCRTCKGSGIKRYRLPEKRRVACDCEIPGKCRKCEGTKVVIWNERICQSCRGDGDEVISPETSLNAAAHLAKYVAPQLKQTDHVSSDGSSRPQWQVVIVDNNRQVVGGANERRVIQAPKE